MKRVSSRVCRRLAWLAWLTAAGGMLASCDTPVGVGYLLINGGGSGGGERGRQSMRRFAREILPLFPDQSAVRAAE